MMNENRILGVPPIQPCGTKESACTFVVETAVHFDVASEWRVERLASGSYPVQHRTLKTFRVVRSGA
jgi:hypothetical protein